VDLKGRGGCALDQVRVNGPNTYLGISIADFPKLFVIIGPQCPSPTDRGPS
jgi:hypothetical protein